jgi:hypothetical protein
MTSVLLVTDLFAAQGTWRWFSDMFETYVTFLVRNEAVWSNLLKGIRMTSVSDVALFVIQTNYDLQWGKKFPFLCTLIVLRCGSGNIGRYVSVMTLRYFLCHQRIERAAEFQTLTHMHTHAHTHTRFLFYIYRDRWENKFTMIILWNVFF